MLASRLQCSLLHQPHLEALSRDRPTVASHLAKQGFDTMTVVTNSHLTRTRNFDKGFDRFVNLRVDTLTPNDESDTLERFISKVRAMLNEAKNKVALAEDPGTLSTQLTWLGYALYRYRQYPDKWPSIPSADVLTRSETELSNRGGDSPFFAWTHLMDLHAPLHPDVVREAGLLECSVPRMLY